MRINKKFNQNLINKKNKFNFSGIQIAFIVLYFFFYFTNELYYLFEMNSITYYWLCFTVLTGIWEFYYISQKKKIKSYSDYLLSKKKHVWSEKYYITGILPWNTSKIFYSEYAAYADREYKRLKDNWSQIIEGSHAILCGLFALFALYNNYISNIKNFYITMSISMGTQLMNSILYMSQYNIQIKTKKNINYNTISFPCGKYLIDRPFMYINIFWTIMPLYILLYSLW